jgi:hypothetical protein
MSSLLAALRNRCQRTKCFNCSNGSFIVLFSGLPGLKVYYPERMFLPSLFSKMKFRQQNVSNIQDPGVGFPSLAFSDLNVSGAITCFLLSEIQSKWCDVSNHYNLVALFLSLTFVDSKSITQNVCFLPSLLSKTSAKRRNVSNAAMARSWFFPRLLCLNSNDPTVDACLLPSCILGIQHDRAGVSNDNGQMLCLFCLNFLGLNRWYDIRMICSPLLFKTTSRRLNVLKLHIQMR